MDILLRQNGFSITDFILPRLNVIEMLLNSRHRLTLSEPHNEKSCLKILVKLVMSRPTCTYIQFGQTLLSHFAFSAGLEQIIA